MSSIDSRISIMIGLAVRAPNQCGDLIEKLSIRDLRKVKQRDSSMPGHLLEWDCLVTGWPINFGRPATCCATRVLACSIIMARVTSAATGWRTVIVRPNGRVRCHPIVRLPGQERLGRGLARGKALSRAFEGAIWPVGTEKSVASPRANSLAARCAEEERELEGTKGSLSDGSTG